MLIYNSQLICQVVLRPSEYEGARNEFANASLQSSAETGQSITRHCVRCSCNGGPSGWMDRIYDGPELPNGGPALYRHCLPSHSHPNTCELIPRYLAGPTYGAGLCPEAVVRTLGWRSDKISGGFLALVPKLTSKR